MGRLDDFMDGKVVFEGFLRNNDNFSNNCFTFNYS